jgi:hypothetical protein
MRLHALSHLGCCDGAEFGHLVAPLVCLLFDRLCERVGKVAQQLARDDEAKVFSHHCMRVRV